MAYNKRSTKRKSTKRPSKKRSTNRKSVKRSSKKRSTKRKSTKRSSKKRSTKRKSAKRASKKRSTKRKSAKRASEKRSTKRQSTTIEYKVTIKTWYSSSRVFATKDMAMVYAERVVHLGNLKWRSPYHRGENKILNASKGDEDEDNYCSIEVEEYKRPIVIAGDDNKLNDLAREDVISNKINR